MVSVKLFTDSLSGRIVNVWSCVRRSLVFRVPSYASVCCSTIPNGQTMAFGMFRIVDIEMGVQKPNLISFSILFPMMSGLSRAFLWLLKSINASFSFSLCSPMGSCRRCMSAPPDIMVRMKGHNLWFLRSCSNSTTGRNSEPGVDVEKGAFVIIP